MANEGAHGSAQYDLYWGSSLQANTWSHTYIGYDRPSKSANSITTYIRCACQSSRDLSSNGFRVKYYNWPGWDDQINHYITTWDETGWRSASGVGAGGSRSHTSGIRQSLNATSSATWYLPSKHTARFYRNYDSSDSTIFATDGGWGSAANFSADSVSFPGNPSRTGYAFNGWYNARSGGSKVTSGSHASDFNAYAQWTEITYAITFDKNDPAATGSMSQINKGSGGAADGAAGTAITIPECAFTKEAYHFVGWATSASGPIVYQPGDTYSTNAALTLYAKWEVNYIKPNFVDLPVVQRCDASGSAQDDGTYVRIAFNWTAFDATFANAIKNGFPSGATHNKANSTIYVEYRASGASTPSYLSFNGTVSHVSGTLTGSFVGISTTPNQFSIDETYSIIVCIQDVLNDTTGDHTNSIQTFISTAFFTMDVYPDGTAIGFGCSAPNPQTEYSGEFADNGILKVDMELIAGIDLTITEEEYNELMGS